MSPERLERWLTGFDERHRVDRTVHDTHAVRFEAADAALAECHVPFPPLPYEHQAERPGLDPGPLVAHVRRERTVGVLLARLGGHAAGVFEGSRLIASKVGSRPVHGRNKAGGQSQKRFQRRREEQAREAMNAAGGVAARVLLPYVPRLDAVVLGGDRRAVDRLREDGRLAPVFDIATDRFLDVPDPKLAVLRAAPRRFRAVRIRLVEPE